MNGLYVSAEIFAKENTKSKLEEKPIPNDLIVLFVGNVKSLILNKLQMYSSVLISGMHNKMPKNIANIDSE